MRILSKKLRVCDDLKLAPSSASSTRSTFLTNASFSEGVEDWMYWQRDALNAKCWTKVYAVLENEFLWLFKGAKSSKSLFMQIAVASVEISGERQFRLVDPNGEDMELWLLDQESFEIWKLRLQEAAIITTEYFRAFSLDVEKLPRSSAYRGSLVVYRRIGKRARCKAVLTRIVSSWRLKCRPLVSTRQSIC
ncbi:hypothetical protein FI667_g15156, partial [Globisporangium splendens]